MKDPVNIIFAKFQRRERVPLPKDESFYQPYLDSEDRVNTEQEDIKQTTVIYKDEDIGLSCVAGVDELEGNDLNTVEAFTGYVFRGSK